MPENRERGVFKFVSAGDASDVIGAGRVFDFLRKFACAVLVAGHFAGRTRGKEFLPVRKQRQEEAAAAPASRKSKTRTAETA